MVTDEKEYHNKQSKAKPNVKQEITWITITTSSKGV